MHFFTIIAFVFFGILGALSGSFTGVIAERLHTGGSWMRGRSRCNTCDRTLEPRDLIPVISWILARGTCRTCCTRIPVRYVVIELVFAAIFIMSYITIGLTPLLPLFLLEIVVLGALVLYDIRHMIVPNTLSGATLFLALVFALGSATSGSDLGVTLLTAGLMGLGFFLLHTLSQGRAMGLGDTPVVTALALLTKDAAIPGLLFSFWIGALFGGVVLVMRWKGHRMDSEVPFVPFLVAGFLLAYFTGWNPLNIAFL